MSETRQFKMHPKLLFDVIQRQAGSLSKALLEGIMNAVDAKAKKVDVTLSATQATIRDDGTGFRNRTEIEQFFETFGQPHEESEGKVYGQFRMGRGQLFSYGVNTWSSGTFGMLVDIQYDGLDYRLTSIPKQAGCYIKVDLYNHLMPSALDATIRDLERMVKYCPIPVVLNGTTINKPPKKQKWDVETDDAYIRFRKIGGLYVYNLGVLVQELSGYKFGTGGEVVSKQQLRVNFARNEVLSDCPVWKRIVKEVDQRASKTNKEATLNDAGRQRLADQLRLGLQSYDELRKAKLLTDVTGRHWALSSLQYKKGVCTAAPDGDTRGDKFMQLGLGFVFADSTLQRFDVATVEDLLKLLHERAPYGFDELEVIPYSELKRAVNSTYKIIPEKELSPIQMAALSVLQTLSHYLAYQLTAPGEDELSHVQVRQVRMGRSSTARAWTNGSTYIVFDVDYVAHVGTGAGAWTQLALILLHEYCHDEADTETHTHTPEFYQAFHDGKDEIGPLVDRALGLYPQRVLAAGRKLTKQQLKLKDKLELARRAESKVRTATKAVELIPMEGR